VRNQLEVQNCGRLSEDQDHADEAAQPGDKAGAGTSAARTLEAGGLVLHAGRKAPDRLLDKGVGRRGGQPGGVQRDGD
jgi:general stress protein YciG